LILDAHVVRHEQQQARQTSPITAPLACPVLPDTTSFIQLKPKKRPRSNTNQSAPQPEADPYSPVTPAQVSYNELASAFYVINSKYRITWECAELLIELGAGGTNDDSNENFASPTASASAPIASQFSSAHGLESIGTKCGRERAVTLAGDESKPTQPPLVPYSVPRLPTDHDSLVSSLSNGFASPSTSWRTSTGRHDLSQRQLVLLREMLNNTHVHANVIDIDGIRAKSQEDTPVPDKSAVASRSQTQPRLYVAVNNEWKWGDPKNSTVTLPEDGDRVDNSRKAKRRSGKLGMSGLRDLLRALKRGAIAEESAIPSMASVIPIHSTTSLSTESSIGSKRLRRSRQPSQRRKLRTGTVPDSSCPTGETANGRATRTTSPYGPSFTAAKPSPRRPSLASVFRMGGKNRPSNTTNNGSGSVPKSEPADDEIISPTAGTREDNSSIEEDWDRMDSASDLDTAAKALYVIDGSATVRGGRQWDGRKKIPYLEQDTFARLASEQSTDRPLITKRSFGTSQTSIRCIEHQSGNNSSQPGKALRPVRLSNVEEHADDVSSDNGPSPMRSVSQTQPSSQARLHKSGASHPKSGSVRSMPVHVASATMSPTADPKPPLAMTPENIKPLLENAKEVQARLGDCIAELRVLVSRSVEPGMIDGVASGGA
jgi:serine/arginine repetitive matrix protein 2